MMNKLFFFLFLLFGLVSCGDDEQEPELGPETTNCNGDISITVDGMVETYENPFSATLVDLNLDAGSELLVVWINGGKSLSFQIVINESSLDCFPTGRVNVRDLPAGISLLGFQYQDVNGKIGSVSNIFIEDGGDGWVDIISCDGENETVSADFEFDAVTTSGEIIEIRGGRARDICFKRSK